MTVRHRARHTVLAMTLWACHAAWALAGWEEGAAAWKAGQYEQAWAQLKPLAQAGDAKARYRVGMMLLDGQGVPEDAAQALHWLGLAAQQGDADAQVMFGYLHERGIGTPADPAEAVRWYRRAADSGDAKGQTYLAVMYREGVGVPVDAAMALQWLRRAAAQDHPRAIYLLAEMADEGEGDGDPVDLTAALAGYRRAAELGYAPAQAMLGAWYFDGRGVAPDDAQAVHWYELAAAQGNGMALTNLGRMHMAGQGGLLDSAEAVALWRRAAEAGHLRGMAELGVAYIDGKGVERDPATGVQWLRKAADAGSPQGRFRLAWAYLEGEGVAEDARKACELFEASAQSGYPPGMREYGQRLALGEGCATDLEQARQWYERAAAKGDPRAMYLLGTLHDFGRGVPMSKGHAVYWYVRAARRGLDDARNNLGVMYRDGEFVAQDPAIAMALFRLVAEAGQELGKRNRDKTAAMLDAPARQRVTALVEALQRPASFDAALDDSLAAAQGLPPASQATADAAAPCVPTPAVPTQAQLQAWHRDVHDRGPLWRITKDGRTSWLYGTIHVGRANWLVPGPNITQALLASDVLALESDAEDAATQAAMARARDRMLALDRPQYQAELEAALGVACASALRQQRTPQVMQAMVVSLRDAAAEQQHAAFGVEMLLKALAQRRQKAVVELESADESLTTLMEVFSLGEGTRLQVDLELGPERRTKVLRRLSRDWETGDIEDMARYEEWCECADDAMARAVTERLIDARNPGMAERIDALHQQGKRVLAAVGALHMAGPRGLPALLAAHGYQVERVMPQRPMPAPLEEIRVDVAQTQTAARR